MGNAFWLFFALPKWFFSSILAPFSAGALTLIPVAGIVCLIIGIVLAVRLRAKSLWVFAFPALASQALVTIAGFMRGAFANSSSVLVLFAFLAIQLGLSSYLVYRFREARLPAILLAVFSLSYAFYASFIAGMAFTDDWL